MNAITTYHELRAKAVRLCELKKKVEPDDARLYVSSHHLDLTPDDILTAEERQAISDEIALGTRVLAFAAAERAVDAANKAWRAAADEAEALLAEGRELQ